MKWNLRDLALGQQEYFSDHGVFKAGTFSSVDPVSAPLDVTMDFVPYAGIRVTVTTVGDPPGWAATTSHVRTPRNAG